MKIDTSTIQGFDGMSAEQKLAAVLGMDMPEPDMSGWVKKDVFDAKASEASNLSKQLKARMTEEEAKKAEDAAARQELEDKYNELLKRTTISDYKAKYLAMGYDEKLAADTAQAIAEGNMDKVFANSEKFKAELEKKIRADILKDTPRPGADNGGKSMTMEDISKIRDASERQAAIAKNLELYGYKER
jgi:hypothetical protein